MYAWIWRQLPGPAGARAVQASMIALVVVVVLFFLVFPWLAPLLPFDRVAVG